MNEANVLKPVQVIAQFDDDGKISPLRFNWLGQWVQITSTGRSWEDHLDRHILVMVPGERVFELIFNSTELRWYLKTGSTMTA